MSGLVGLFDRTGATIAEETIEQMLAALSHRGPDGRDLWLAQAVGLGQQMFATTPASGVRGLPLSRDGSTDLVLVADARIDNRHSLRSSLGSKLSENPTDADLIHAAYQQWGLDVPRHLVGAFAFTIWDNEKTRLFCARDHMGIRPLYFTRSGQRIACASEPKALHTLKGVTRHPDEQRIGKFLIGEFDVGTRTFFEDVERLPAGHILVATPDTIDVQEYWSPDPTRELELDSDDAYERRFRDIFFEAVRCRLRGRGPIGSFLSGGIDSSSIVSTAEEILHNSERQPLHTFSAVFDEVTSCDEREYIHAVLDAGDYTPHTIPGDRVKPLFDLDRHLKHQDSPFYPSLFMLIWRLLHEVNAEDVSIVLNGYGGDQVLCNDLQGYPHELARSLQFGSCIKALRSYARRYPEVRYRDLIRNELLVPAIPRKMRELRHLQFNEQQYLDRTPFPVDPAFAKSAGLLERLREDAITRPPGNHRAFHHRDLVSGEPTYNLELSDLAAAANGVEMRFPFFDKRVVEFCLALPPDQKIRDGLGRSIARRALSRVLPSKIQTRDTKADFTKNVIHTTLRYELERIDEILFCGERLGQRYLKYGQLHDAHEEFQTNGNWKHARALLTATVLERWLENHTETEAVKQTMS